MFISFIVPIYNESVCAFKKCIKSIIHQKGNYEFEIIIIDDGSINKYSKRYQSFLENLNKKLKTNNIHYYKQENQGLSISRNVGFLKAQGDFIAFIDSDDYIVNDYLQTLSYYVNKYKNIDFIRFNYFNKKGFFKKSNNFLEKYMDGEYLFHGDDLFYILIYRISQTTWDGIYKKEFLIKNEIFHPRIKNIYHEDVCFFLETINLSNNFLIIDKPLYVYNRNYSVISKSTNYKKRLFDIYKNISIANNFILLKTKNHMLYYEKFQYCYNMFNSKEKFDNDFKIMMANYINNLESLIDFKKRENWIKEFDFNYCKKSGMLYILVKIKTILYLIYKKVF